MSPRPPQVRESLAIARTLFRLPQGVTQVEIKPSDIYASVVIAARIAVLTGLDLKSLTDEGQLLLDALQAQAQTGVLLKSFAMVTIVIGAASSVLLSILSQAARDRDYARHRGQPSHGGGLQSEPLAGAAGQNRVCWIFLCIHENRQSGRGGHVLDFAFCRVGPIQNRRSKPIGLHIRGRAGEVGQNADPAICGAETARLACCDRWWSKPRLMVRRPFLIDFWQGWTRCWKSVGRP